jgi:integrase
MSSDAAKALTQLRVESLQPKGKRYKVYDARQAGLFVQISPTGRKVYYCYIRVNGKATDYKLGSCEELNLKQARELAGDALLKARRGVSVAKERVQTRSDTLRGFIADRYKAYLWANHRDPAASLWTLEVPFAELQDERLVDIASGRIEQWRIKHGQQLAPATLNRRVGALKAALGKAKLWGLIESNPLQDLSKVRVPKRPVEFLNGGQVDVLRSALAQRDAERSLQRDQYNTWLAARGRTDRLPSYEDDLEISITDHLTPFVVLILYTGLRFKEAINLKWSDLSMDNVLMVTDYKSASFRYMPVVLEVQLMLEELKRLNRANLGREVDHVFVGTDGSPLAGMKTSWNGLRRRLPFACDWRMLRRTFGSLLIKKGVPIYHVSQLLGHTNVETTQKWYLGLNVDDYRVAVQSLSKIEF